MEKGFKGENWQGNFERQLWEYRPTVMRVPTQRAVTGQEKRCFKETLSLDVNWLDGAVQGDAQILNNGWLVQPLSDTGNIGGGQDGVGAMLSLAEDMLCWRIHETSSLTKCVLKTSRQFSGLFQFLSPPSPCLPLSLPPISPTKTKSLNQNSEKCTWNSFHVHVEYCTCLPPPRGSCSLPSKTHMCAVHCLTHSLNDCLYKCTSWTVEAWAGL